MKWRIIFLICLLSVGFIKCSEEGVRNSSDSPLTGSWEIRWTLDNEVLTGLIEFKGNEATIQAYGAPGSHLLSTFEEATFIVLLSDDSLILKNERSNVELVYEIEVREPDYWELSYLNEINVALAKK